jgi:arylsulfatase A-like enzyme
VVLIVIDTIRTDHLGCYGYALPTSPNIDAFASEAALFEQAVTSSPLTLPSMSTMLTSTYPVFNNVRYNGMFFLSDASVTLAELLRDNGYETAAFIGGFPLDSRFRADQGFDLYDDDFSNSTQKRRYGWIGHRVDDFERTGEEVNQQTFKWLEKIGDEPFFLMVHYFDPHLPYTPPGPYDDEFEIPYDGEVAYTDEHVGGLLDKLEKLGLKENTLIVLTGDHGESLGTHNEVTHGEFIYDTTVMIPLILYHSERIPKGRRIPTMVRSIDIMPTILDFLGVPDSPHAQGRSLLPALEGKLEEAPALLEATLHYYEGKNLGHEPMMITGLRTSEWKLMHVTVERDGKPGWIGELYNIADEPQELTNVSEENPEILRNLIEELNALTLTHSKGALPKGNRLEMDEETRAKLKALGYLGN